MNEIPLQKVRKIVLSIRQKRDFPSKIKHFKSNHNDLDLLLNIIYTEEEYPLTEYATWILVHLTKSDSSLVQQYYTPLVDVLFKTNNQTILRNITNVLNHLSITTYRESEVIDLLINFIQDANNKVALQVYSMYVLIQFVHIYPELKQEIIEIIELNSIQKSAAYNAAYRNFLQAAKKI
ncbi:MAG: hypothetical protein MK066_06435 [Crocinitomicaceae bacterium]|nr:hypothetical protein [Crocinitomicaceae bacterium]